MQLILWFLQHCSFLKKKQKCPQHRLEWPTYTHTSLAGNDRYFSGNVDASQGSVVWAGQHLVSRDRCNRGCDCPLRVRWCRSGGIRGGWTSGQHEAHTSLMVRRGHSSVTGVTDCVAREASPLVLSWKGNFEQDPQLRPGSGRGAGRVEALHLQACSAARSPLHPACVCPVRQRGEGAGDSRCVVQAY